MHPIKVEALWAHFHWLIVLGEQGSYTAAAARLGVSKAAMSQRIAELERAVGVMLVRRTTRSMRLTEAGQRLVDDMRAPFEQIAHSFLGARDAEGVPRGLIRVTVPVALGRQQIVPRVATFLQKHSAIRVEMELSDDLVSLATEGFDLAIRHAQSAPDTHVAWSLCNTESLLVASHSYLAACGTPASPHELIEHQCLHYPRGHGERVWSFEPRKRGASKRVSVQVAGPFAANNSEALRDAAEAGLGIALVPDFTAREALKSGRLEQVLPSWRPVGTFAEKIFAIRPYSLHVPRAVNLFVRHLRDTL